MFKFRFFSLVVISMMLILGLSAIPVLADGIKVDDDINCADVVGESSSNRETNILTSAGAFLATIWISAPQGLPIGDLTFEVFPQGNSKTASCLAGDPVFVQCAAPDDEWWYYQFSTCAGSGVFTLIVYEDLETIGQDTWRQVP